MKIKRNIKASAQRRPIKAATDEYMLSEVIGQKDAIINEWRSTYDGEPSTSWDEIFDNVVNDFELYCDDEASAMGTDRFLKERFDSGELSESDMLTEFYDFIRFIDLADYDIAASTDADGKAVTAAVKVDDLQWGINWLNDHFGLTDDESNKFFLYQAYGKVQLAKAKGSGMSTISPLLSKPALNDALSTVRNVLAEISR